MIQQAEHVRSGLEALRHRYARNLPTRVAALREQADVGLEGGTDEAGWKEVHRLAHSLAGSSGTHRFEEVRSAARELEGLAAHLVEAPTGVTPETITRVRSLLDALAARAEDARLSVLA